jgi:hypothetical protein
MVATFSAGRTWATTVSMPTSAATACAAAELGDRLRAGRFHRVRDDQQATHGAVPADSGDRPARRFGGFQRFSKNRVERHRPLGRQPCGTTGGNGVAVDHSMHAEALRADERLDTRQVADAFPGAARHGGGDRMLRGVLQRTGQAEQLSLVATGRGNDLDQLHPAAPSVWPIPTHRGKR